MQRTGNLRHVPSASLDRESTLARLRFDPAKNTAQLYTLFALANLVIVEKTLLAPSRALPRSEGISDPPSPQPFFSSLLCCVIAARFAGLAVLTDWLSITLQFRLWRTPQTLTLWRRGWMRAHS